MMILKISNKCIKEMDDFLKISLPDGSIRLMLFESRRNFIKRSTVE